MEENKLEKLKISLDDLTNKRSKIYFFLPPVQEPNSSTYEIYFHGNVLAKNGFDVTLVGESEDYNRPFYIDKELFEGLKYETIDSGRFTLGPEDILVIPDILTNIMEQTKNLPSIRIVFHQSLDYMYNALMLMTSYPSYGMNNVIVNSKDMKTYLSKTLGGNVMDIQTYDIGIPDYFKPSEKPKEPTICFLSRNPNDITKIIKDFYSKNPMYTFVTFESMYSNSNPPRQLTRKEFANKLSKSFAAVWVDRISSFGTFPLECMKSGTIPVGLIPDFVPPYLFDENGKPYESAGLWSNSGYEVSDILGRLVSMFLDDVIPQEIYDNMSSASKNYTVENSEQSIISCYQYYIDKRASSIKKAIENLENKNKVETLK